MKRPLSRLLNPVSPPALWGELLLGLSIAVTPLPVSAQAVMPSLISGAGNLASGTQTINAFTAETWSQMLKTIPRPAVIMFTSSDCTHCPGTLKNLRRIREEQRLKWSLSIVQIDEEAYDFGDANDARWRFAGNIQRLQYSVNPKWRGITPYIVLLHSDGGTEFILGAPGKAQLTDLR